MPGKTFTDRSIRRIADAVHYVEEQRLDKTRKRREPKRGGEGRTAICAVITACSKSSGYASIRQTASWGATTPISGSDTLKAVCGIEEFFRSGDAVIAVPLSGDAGGAEWALLPFVRGMGLWSAPTTGELAATQDNPTQATYCTDTIA